jgi:hypothetical protein
MNNNIHFYENYIYINKFSLSKELCENIINMFEEEKNGKYEGITASGITKNIKNTTDFIIPKNINDNNEITTKKWAKVQKVLDEELNRNVKLYINKITKSLNLDQKEDNTKYYIFPKKFLTCNNFMVQKYTINEGRYKYHDDFRIDWLQEKYRVITYIWYLNTVEEGGETEIWHDFKIKPETGKLLLFPSSWTFPHRGIMPISSNKYIITGWLYVTK